MNDLPPSSAVRSRHRWRVAAVAAAMMAVAIVYLRRQGRVWWCACGSFNPVALHVNSMHNSQHLLDAYSFSHVLHGLILYGFFGFIARRVALGWRLVSALSVEIVWEMMENSAFIINRYRENTASLGYSGDSIVNSCGDVLSFVAGFYAARRLGWRWSVVVFVAVELAMLLAIRDNLTLNVLMLVWPIKAVRRWQTGA